KREDKDTAARVPPADQPDRPDQAQANRPGPDQRVPESSLAITENTSSEPVREFWHGTGVAEFVRVCPLIVGVQWTTRRWLLWTAGVVRVDPGERAFYFGEQAQPVR